MQGKPSTNKKKNNQLIQASEILESISDGFFSLDREWRFYYVNKRAAGILNLQPEDLLGQNIWEKYPQLIGTELELKYRQAMNESQFQEFDMKGILSDMWFHIRVYPSNLGISVFWQDITQRKRLEEDNIRLAEELATYNEELLSQGEELLSQNELLHAQAEELRLTQQKAFEMRDEYRNLYNFAPVGFVTLDKQGHILEANETLASLLGVDKNHLLKSWFTKYIPTEFSDVFYFCLRQALKDSTPQICEIQMLKADGSRFYSRLDSLLIGDGKSSPEQILVAVSDMTEHKKAEEVIRESEEKYRSLFDNMTESFVILEPVFDTNGEPRDFRIQEVNKSAANLVGLTEEETRGKTFLEIDPNYETHWKENFSKVALTGEPVRIEQYNGYLNKWLDVYAYKPEKGIIAVISTDITKRKKAEQALNQSEEQFRIIFERSTIGKTITLPDGTMVRVNQTFADMLGYTISEIQQHNFAYFTHPDDMQISQECVHNLLSGEQETCHFEKRYLHKNGSPVWAHVSATLMKNTTREPLYFITSILDITERKKAEEALARAKDELETKVKERTYELAEANEQLKQYAQKITQVQEEERKRIAYELHDDTAQYLSILKMQLGTLVNSEKILSQEIKEKLQFLERDADRAFNDVRRYSHELRPVVLEHQGLAAALEQIADDYNKLGQLNVKVDIEGVEPELSEEVKLGLFRIAQEAINNTRKHAQASQATIDLRFNHDYAKMTVSDDGTGFNTREAISRSAGQGSLGLISMRERASLINADLKVESAPGQGTKVIVKTKL